MFIHNFKYALKTLFKNKELIFWTFAFPLILATLFNMAFSNITNSEKLDIIKIAIVENDTFKNNEVFKSSFETLSDPNNEDRLFDTAYTTEDNAKKMLEQDEIVGYMKLIDGEPEITVNTNGIDQTIFKYTSEEISQTYNMIKNLSTQEIEKALSSGNYNIDYENIYQKVINSIDSKDVKLKNISNDNLDYSMIEFYTLIAMTCLYGGILAMVAINQNLANMSDKGKRVSIAPTKKSTVIISSLLASFITQLIGLSLLLIYTIFVLKIDYGNNTPLIILLSLIGSLSGLSLGLFVGTVLKSNENIKTGILIATTMFFCFLSGMFGITMKYLVDKNIPILNKINPVSMITDGFYSLYYYTTQDRYWFNITSLLVFSLILILISVVTLRRQKYDSI